MKPRIAQIVLLILAIAPNYLGARECTKAEAMAVEAKAAYLKSWAEVHAAYGKYHHCDDGAIASGFTESITQLLAHRWGSLSELARRADADEGFRKFVLKHISASAHPDALKRIAMNASSNCPRGLDSLCTDIGGRARESR